MPKSSDAEEAQDALGADAATSEASQESREASAGAGVAPPIPAEPLEPGAIPTDAGALPEVEAEAAPGPEPELDAPDADQRICIATRDETALVLPDGRPPQIILIGPFTTYLVCG